MEVRQHRGVQFKYCGHIVNFCVNNARVFSRLPLVPEELDVIILKPPPSDNNDPEQVNRQFRKDYQVRRPAVMLWLHFLIRNHSGYRDVSINTEAEASLPVDNYVDHCLSIVLEEQSSPAPPVISTPLSPVLIPDLIPLSPPIPALYPHPAFTLSNLMPLCTTSRPATPPSPLNNNKSDYGDFLDIVDGNDTEYVSFSLD
jgi:hypothetical protein